MCVMPRIYYRYRHYHSKGLGSPQHQWKFVLLFQDYKKESYISTILQPVYISCCTDRDTGLVWYYLIFIPYKLAVWVSWVSRSEHNTKSYLYQLAVAGRWNTFHCPHEWGARCCRQEVAQWTKICRGLQADLWRLQGLPLQCLPCGRFPWPRRQFPGLHGDGSCQLSSQERQEGL